MLDQLPLNALRAFEAAGRLGSFRAASEELGVTQGAVAQKVRGLEERLDTELFERHPRGVRLTRSGERMHSRLQRAFRQMEDAVENLKDQDDPVRLAIPGDLAAGWLEPRRAALMAALPGLVLETCAPESDPEASLETGAVACEMADLMLCAGTPPLGMMAISTGLFDSEVVAVAKPGVLVEGRGFSGVHLLHDSRELWPDFITEVLEMPRPELLGGLHLGAPDASLAAALAGQGVALAERRAVHAALASGALELADANALVSGTSYRLSGPSQKITRPAVRALVDWLIAEIVAEPIDHVASAMPFQSRRPAGQGSGQGAGL